MAERSSLYRLIEKQLGADLAEYVAERRPEQSWRAIAAELSEKIGLDVNHESLRLWFGKLEQAAAS